MSVTMTELRGYLDEIAIDVVPAPRAAFVTDLERRLVDSAANSTASDAAIISLEERRTGQRVPTSRRGLLVAVAVAAAVLVAAGMVSSRDGLGSRVQTVRPADSSTDKSKATADARDGGSRVEDGGDAPSGDVATRSQKDDPLTSGDRGVPAISAPTPKPGTPTDAMTLTCDPCTRARVFLSWPRYEGEDFAAYLVLRSVAPNEPNYPADEQKTLIMRRIETRGQTSYDDTPKVGASSSRYLVVVVDSQNRALARTNVVDSDRDFSRLTAPQPDVGVKLSL